VLDTPNDHELSQCNVLVTVPPASYLKKLRKSKGSNFKTTSRKISRIQFSEKWSMLMDFGKKFVDQEPANYV
jgi:hypothetical protein